MLAKFFNGKQVFYVFCKKTKLCDKRGILPYFFVCLCTHRMTKYMRRNFMRTILTFKNRCSFGRSMRSHVP